MKGLLVFLFFVSQLTFFGTGEKLAFALVVVKQGEETPPSLFPKVKSEWNQVLICFSFSPGLLLTSSASLSLLLAPPNFFPFNFQAWAHP